ncbi:MAG: UDP-3-O-(3-hydroxymyristoyl)glucosamine N-acyltransferase [bacterium]
MKLNLTSKTLAQIVGGDLQGHLDSSLVIQNIASLSQAGPDDLAVLIDKGDQSVFDAVKPEEIVQSKAQLFLAAQPIVEGKNYILVKDPLGAFEKLVHFVQAQNQKHTEFEFKNGAYISSTASVASNVTIAPSVCISAHANVGSGTTLGAHVFIGQHCHIGSNVFLHPGVKILDGCCVGDNSIIHANTVIGSDGFGYSVTKMGLRKIPQIGIVQIGKHVEIGAHCSIDRASFDKTIIEDGVKIDNNVHIAHNVKIGACTAILALTGIAGSVTIGKGCQIGGQVAIKNGINIGDGAKIVSKSAVMNNVKEHDVICGIPAIPFTQWKRMTVAMTKLPEIFKVAREVSTILSKQKQKKSFFLKIVSFFKRN